MKRFVAFLLALVLTTGLAGGYFSIGYQTAGGLEYGGGGYGGHGRFLFGGEGHGSPAGYGYGLGFVAYDVGNFEFKGVKGRLLPRFGLGGGGGESWAGLLVEAGLWVSMEYAGFPGALYLAYQYAPDHSGVLFRLDLGGPAP